jgi:hypothetical protein
MSDLITRIIRGLMSVEEGKGNVLAVEKVRWGDPSGMMRRGAIDVESSIDCRLPIDCAIRFVSIRVFDRLDHHRFEDPNKALRPSI